MAQTTRKSKPTEKQPKEAEAAKKPVRAKAAAASSTGKTPTKGARTAKKPVQPKKAAKPVQKLTIFELEAPYAREVYVAGCFNNWDPLANPLQRQEAGIWRGTVSIEPGEHQYRFVVDGEWWDDPINALRRWNEYGTENCILIVEE